jgi:chromosome segregation ATPase
VAAAERQRGEVARQLDAMRNEVATAERRRAEIAGQIAATEARLAERRTELTDLEARVRRAREAVGSDSMSVTVPGQTPAAPR